MRENWYCCSEVQRGWLQELQDLLGEREIICSFAINIIQAVNCRQFSLESFCDVEKAQKPSPVISINLTDENTLASNRQHACHSEGIIYAHRVN